MIYLKFILFLTIIYLTNTLAVLPTTKLNCEFRPTYFFLMQKCYVKDLTEKNPNAVYTFGDVSDVPDRFVMEFEDCQLYNIPNDMLKTYNAFKIIIKNCGLIEIGENRFISATVLKSVDLSNNNISEIKSDAFKGANLLEFLDMSNNQIEKIDENGFRGVGVLGAIDLGNNRIKTLSSTTFLYNPAIYQIKLRNNFIEKIESTTFSRLNKLMTLDVAFNNLSEFNDYSSSMSFLYIAYNQLKHLVIGEEIWKLVANNNNITAVTIGKRNEIYNLVLSNNSITDIENFTSLTKLTDLYLSHNKLSTIKPIENLKGLNIVYMEDVGLKQDELKYFEKLTSLSWLDISYNLLQTLDIKIFNSQSQLTIFHIDGNNLTELNFKEVKNSLPNLHVISISNNYWNCSHLDDILEQFKADSIELFIESHTRVIEGEKHRDGVGCFNKTLTADEFSILSKPSKDISAEKVDEDTNSDEAKIHDSSKETLLSEDLNFEKLHKKVVLLEGSTSDFSKELKSILPRLAVLEGKGSFGVIVGVLIMLAMFFVTYKVVLIYMAKRKQSSLNDRLIEQQM